MKSLYRIAFGFCSMAAAAAASARSVYRLTEVPVLPGYAPGYAISINDNGDVAGYYQTSVAGFNYVGFTFRNGQ